MKRMQIITPIIVGIAAIASLIATANDALALSRAEIKQIVISEATNSLVPPSLALAVAKIESAVGLWYSHSCPTELNHL